MTSYNMKADFAKSERFPLIKTKFGFFNSAYVPYERWMRDVDLLCSLKPVSMRYEIGWGMGNSVTDLGGNKAFPQEFDAPQITGSEDDMKIAFEQMDGFVCSLKNRKIVSFLINCYNPVILQKEGGDYTTIPKNPESWKRLNEKFAGHFAEKSSTPMMFEIWNEPDLDVFFTGSKEDFFEVYRMGSEGVRAGAPDVKVGGPALSVAHDWAEPFLDFVSQKKVPMDFFSFHMFAAENPEEWIQEYRRVLSAREEFNDRELILSEYNPLSFQTNGKDFNAGGFIERYEFAQEVLHQICFLLRQPDISMVNWAQFNDPSVFGASADRCGIVDVNGLPKSAYHAFKIYADMPVDRCNFISENSVLEGLAAADMHRAAVAFWNRSSEVQKASIKLDNIPYDVKRCRLYRIDKEHGNYFGEKEEAAFVPEYIEMPEDSTWQGEIPGYGVVYLAMDDEEAYAEEAALKGEILQTMQYYYNRQEKTYAAFEQETWTVRFYAEHESSRAMVGILARGLASRIRCRILPCGDHAVKNGNVFLRVDYLPDKEEKAASGVLFHMGGREASKEQFRFGTGRTPDKTIDIQGEEFTIDLKKYAPDGWNNGRVLLSAGMEGAYAGEMIKVFFANDVL